jgi:hypothetical protein
MFEEKIKKPNVQTTLPRYTLFKLELENKDN